VSFSGQADHRRCVRHRLSFHRLLHQLVLDAVMVAVLNSKHVQVCSLAVCRHVVIDVRILVAMAELLLQGWAQPMTHQTAQIVPPD